MKNLLAIALLCALLALNTVSAQWGQGFGMSGMGQGFGGMDRQGFGRGRHGGDWSGEYGRHGRRHGGWSGEYGNRGSRWGGGRGGYDRDDDFGRHRNRGGFGGFGGW